MATTEVESYLGLAAKRCDSCKGSPAAIFCGADTAFLCCACDARLHGANTLASRHGRVWLCEVCEQAPAAVTCKADAATLCVTCDADIHAANPLARRHERLPVVPFYDPFSAAIKPSAADGFNCDDEEENKPAAVTWMISGPGPGFNLNPNPKMMEAPDLNSFFAYVDPYLDLDYADGLVPVQGKPVVAGGGGSDGAPPLPPQAAMMAPDDSVVEIDFALGKQSYSSYNGHSLSHSDQVSSSEVGVVPDGGGSAMADVSNPYGRPPPNPAAMMDREARVMRYREKRKNRKFEKTIRYASRKAYAETRPRIKGRFAKRVEMDSDVDRIYSSAATAVAPAAGMFVDNGDQQVLTKTYPVDFRLTLDVEELTDTSYQKFITDLRNLAKGAKSSGNVPILPYYGKDNSNLFDVLLTTSDGNVIVRVRRQDVYVQGYLMETNQWKEFNVNKIHMVDPESTFLDFGFLYDQMEKAAGAEVTQIYYTKARLRDAVIKLSKSTAERQQAKSLIFMAQMISEAARFVDVSRFFGSHLDNDEYLPLWMRKLQNDFGKFSKVGQCYDKYKGRYTYKEVIINGVVYKTVDQLRGIFGLMLEEHNLDEKTCGIKKFADED